jgi:hypothetical protein
LKYDLKFAVRFELGHCNNNSIPEILDKVTKILYRMGELGMIQTDFILSIEHALINMSGAKGKRHIEGVEHSSGF